MNSGSGVCVAPTTPSLWSGPVRPLPPSLRSGTSGVNVASGFPAFDPFPGLFSALPLRKVPKSRQNRAHFPPLRVSLSGGWGAPPTTLILLRNQRSAPRPGRRRPHPAPHAVLAPAPTHPLALTVDIPPQRIRFTSSRPTHRAPRASPVASFAVRRALLCGPMPYLPVWVRDRWLSPRLRRFTS